MRRAGTVLLVLTVVGLLPARAAADPVPTPDAPVVVAGVPVTIEQARQRTGRDAEEFDITAQLRLIVHARWVAGEAARLGVTASPTRVAAALAREQRAAGGLERWRQYLDLRGIAEAEARAQIEERVLREALVDAVTARAHGDPRRWGRVMDDFNSRWRATTVCLSTLKGSVRDTCRNVPRPKERCEWYPIGESAYFALGELCRIKREWSVDVDLIEQFHPRADAGDLACSPHGDDALDRLTRYLRRTAPRVARNLFFDADCDPQLIVASYRSAVVTALHAIARIAAAERAR